ncbi:MAG: hypothetical protein OXI63_26305 [Candidatus Poribacteria bacterium]|nr:hypothetical protein [Candidatus Poribacteria bacterium]
MTELRYSPEHEVTFVLPATAFENIFQSLQPPTGMITVGQRDYKLFRRKRNVALHFFAKSDDLDIKLRLQFRFKKGQIKARFSPKMVVGNQIVEGRWKEDIEIGKAFSKVNGFGPIIASFIKEQFKQTYVSGGRRLQLSLDKVIGFNPEASGQHGLPFYHLEVESDYPQSLEEFTNCDYFHNHISPWVRCMEHYDTKWLQASLYCKGDFCFKFSTESSLLDYLMSIKQKLLPRI